MQKEFEKSERGELSPSCEEKCAAPCGVCGTSKGITYNEAGIGDQGSGTGKEKPILGGESVKAPDPTVWRLLFSFTKEGSAVFHGHLSLIEIFSMALTRSGLDVLYTQGFNPLAKMEIVAPLSVGISAGAEIAAADFGYALDGGEFTEKMNAALVEGIRLNRAECFMIPPGAKKHSLSSLLWGFGYQMRNEGTEYVPAREEKALREKYLGAEGTVFSLRRVCVLAKNIIAGGNVEQPWESYFDVYRRLYKTNEQ
jgi:hypothetical protein